MQLTLDPWRARLVRRLPSRFPYAAVEGLLIALLAIQSARILWAAFAPLGPVGPWTAASGAALTADAGLLARFDPFFRASGPGGTVVVTSLPVKLFGIRVDEATGRGSAIIATPDGIQQSFAVGDEIMPGVRLKGVAIDYVTIDRGGASEQLFLDQSVAAPVAVPGAPPAAPPIAAAPLPTAASTVETLKTGIGFAPRVEKGAVTGFVVSPKGSGETFRAAGFVPGDVVTQINGMGFRTVEDAANNVASIPAGGTVTFAVERAGKAVTLTAKASK